MIETGLSVFEQEDRRHGVYGTDAGRIMSGDLLQLFLEKTGRAEPQDLYDRLDPVRDRHLLRHLTREKLVLARLMGHVTEPLNRFWFELQTGREVVLVDEFVHAKHSWMRCHPDGFTATHHGHLAVWDAKFWSRLDDKAIAGALPQMTHNALVCGAEWWILSVFTGNSKWQFVEQEVDPFYAAELMEREAEFWDYVQRDVPPPQHVPEASPAPPPQKLREIDLDFLEKHSLALPNWAGELMPLIRTFADTEGAAKKHAITREDIRKLVPEDVGLLAKGLFLFKRNRAGAVTMSLGKAEEDDVGKC